MLSDWWTLIRLVIAATETHSARILIDVAVAVESVCIDSSIGLSLLARRCLQYKARHCSHNYTKWTNKLHLALEHW